VLRKTTLRQMRPGNRPDVSVQLWIRAWFARISSCRSRLCQSWTRFACEGPTRTGCQVPTQPVRRLAQSALTPTTGPISDATVVGQGLLCLGGPCAGLHRSRLAQSAPVGVFSSALVVSKKLPLSPESLNASRYRCVFDSRRIW